MQKEFYYDSKPQSDIWDNMWTSRTIEEELDACDIESPPRELFLKYLSKKDKIVDAGCGFGKWVIYLHRRGYNIMGIDNNELAISKLRKFDETLQIELGEILNIHYPDNYFDAYISMGVIEHFEGGPLTALKEAYRIVKPGGLIFVSVPTVNIIRKFIRRPLRNTINAIIGSPLIIKSNWKKSKIKAILAPIANPLPEKVKKLLLRKQIRYYHFGEYRFSKIELENYIKQTGFEIIKTLPHDFYDSKDHAIGLIVDFPFFESGNSINFRLNPIGKVISRVLEGISPWIACSSIICVGRSKKISFECLD
jgi:SAM-dependent methyltransferase